MQSWRYAMRAIRLPHDRSGNGSTTVYRFRGYANGATLVSWVDCTIPATRMAVRRMDLGFGVKRTTPGGVSSRTGARMIGSIPGGPRLDTVCDDTGCHLDDLTVRACYYGGTYPYCNSDPASQPATQCGALDPYCNGFGGSYYEGGGWTTHGSGTSPEGDLTAFPEGPLAWAGCVLAMAGSTLAVADVLSAFQDWHAAYRDASGAYDLWQATVQNHSPPAIQQLYEYQYRQARQRQEDKKRAVSSSTNISYLALGGFALACGAAALAPTP